MKSFTMWARASNPKTEPYVAVTATFDDGSKQSIDVNNDEFDHLFQVRIIRAATNALVTVSALHDKSLEVEYELRFDFNAEKNFECNGNGGRTGLEIGGSGGMLYHGQAGEAGPKITVEISATGERNEAKAQILTYRLTCGSRVEKFQANSTSPVYVQSSGGQGGYGIPRPNGDGTNGGNGGDGGDIEIVVDPAVEKYNVTAVSTPGKGGSASDRAKTNPSTRGSNGSAGTNGTTVKRVARVSL
jgi:hypothetical protein